KTRHNQRACLAKPEGSTSGGKGPATPSGGKGSTTPICGKGSASTRGGKGSGRGGKGSATSPNEIIEAFVRHASASQNKRGSSLFMEDVNYAWKRELHETFFHNGASSSQYLNVGVTPVVPNDTSHPVSQDNIAPKWFETRWLVSIEVIGIIMTDLLQRLLARLCAFTSELFGRKVKVVMCSRMVLLMGFYMSMRVVYSLRSLVALGRRNSKEQFLYGTISGNQGAIMGVNRACKKQHTLRSGRSRFHTDGSGSSGGFVSGAGQTLRILDHHQAKNDYLLRDVKKLARDGDIKLFKEIIERVMKERDELKKQVFELDKEVI
nr:hypothetical protein [Tanacetum cinerariifolium]